MRWNKELGFSAGFRGKRGEEFAVQGGSGRGQKLAKRVVIQEEAEELRVRAGSVR